MSASSSSISSDDQSDCSKVRLIWHRRDLRLNDNELYSDLNSVTSAPPLPQHDQLSIDPKEEDFLTGITARTTACTTTTCISLFIFDTHYVTPQPSCIAGADYNVLWHGPHLFQAQVEAVTALRQSLRHIGGELIVRVGDPVKLVPEIANLVHATELVYAEEPGTYEAKVAQEIRRHYLMEGVNRHFGVDTHFGVDMHVDMDIDNRDSSTARDHQITRICSSVGVTLYHPQDLPMDTNQWNQLAHPKNKRKKRRASKKQQDKCPPPSQSHSYYNDIDLEMNLVDISPDRFKGMCRIMGDFRKAARSATLVRPPLISPTRLFLPHDFDRQVRKRSFDVGTVPTVEDIYHPVLSSLRSSNVKSLFGLNQHVIESVLKSAISKRNLRVVENNKSDPYYVSEEAGLNRLQVFLSEGHASTANRSQADVSNNNSSQLSIHLALGTLSPRTIFWKVQEVIDAGGGSESGSSGCQWIQSHLEMRDFFLFTAFGAGKQLFRQSGMPVSKSQKIIEWKCPSDSESHWDRWTTGDTQLPLVDAAMKELMATGYCSNRVRQNAASVLTKDLGIDWRAGAEWFQFLLEDHCVGANWGNWLYFSGVGPDPKHRHFRTVSQALRYDSQGTYVKKWIPALKNINEVEALLRPWDFGVIGFDSPIVEPSTQFTWQDLKRIKDDQEV